LLALNGGVLLFIILWLLVGGSGRGYFAGGAATEVDGILLMLLALFNVGFLVTVFLTLPSTTPSPATADGMPALVTESWEDQARFRGFLRTWSKWALVVNGVLFLFVALWLLVSSDRLQYFQANATEVDMILLFCVSLLNVGYMGMAFLVFSREVAGQKPG
jgi:hypothetical protein